MTEGRNESSNNEGDGSRSEGQTDLGKATKMVKTTNQRETTMAASHGKHESVDSTNVEKTNRINHAGEQQQQPTNMKNTTMTRASHAGEMRAPRRTKKTASSLPISKVSYDAG